MQTFWLLTLSDLAYFLFTFYKKNGYTHKMYCSIFLRRTITIVRYKCYARVDHIKEQVNNPNNSTYLKKKNCAGISDKYLYNKYIILPKLGDS